MRLCKMNKSANNVKEREQRRNKWASILDYLYFNIQHDIVDPFIRCTEFHDSCIFFKVSKTSCTLTFESIQMEHLEMDALARDATQIRIHWKIQICQFPSNDSFQTPTNKVLAQVGTFFDLYASSKIDILLTELHSSIGIVHSWNFHFKLWNACKNFVMNFCATSAGIDNALKTVAVYLDGIFNLWFEICNFWC